MRSRLIIVAALFILAGITGVAAQSEKRTYSKSERFAFGPGGSISIIGAPVGSIRIIGSNEREIEITANFEITASGVADLDRLQQVTTYAVDDSRTSVTIATSGTHNKIGDKKFWKKFPSRLLSAPFRVDYTISVPRYSDVSVNGGKGDITIERVEGSLRIDALESNARLDLVAGGLAATFGSGTIDVSVPQRSWRGSAIDVSLGSGTLNAMLPLGLNAELDAVILRTGNIENSLIGVVPRDRKAPFTERSLSGRAGAGGVQMRFSVADGIIRLKSAAKLN